MNTLTFTSRLRPTAPRRVHATMAFTIVELLVVIAVIGLVLSIAIPGLSGMQAQMDQSSAVQAIDATLARAKHSAAASGDFVALRFMPSAWSGPVDPNADLLDPDRNRMQIVTYEWTTANWLDNMEDVQFVERFEQRPETSIVRLPLNVWVAPMEATLDGDIDGVSGDEADIAEEVVAGAPGDFRLDAGDKNAPNNQSMMQMDDFLIIFDKEGQLYPGPRASSRLNSLYGAGHDPFSIYAYYDPGWHGGNSGDARETDRGLTGGTNDVLYRRYNFGGVATYRRDRFLTAVGGNASIGAETKARVGYLADTARPQMIHPRSARLQEMPR